MRRSSRLIAAASLLLLGACAKEPPPRDPRPQASPAPQAARVSLQHQKSSEPTPSRHPRPNDGSAAPARGGRAPSSEQLAQRYASTRALAVLHGSASYYSDAFAGRSTASGAPYEPEEFTAAHRTLAFGTVLRVTRSEGGASVYVRVTDRGPFGPRGRIVDLSRAAAEQLGMMRAGVVKVKVEVVEYGPPRKVRRRRR